MKNFVFVALILIMQSCKKKDCNDFKYAYYPNEYYSVVEQSTIDEVWIKVDGFVPVTNENADIMVHNNWMIPPSEVETGDTIVKRKGELAISIHKKDTIILHHWYCSGKPYQ